MKGRDRSCVCHKFQVKSFSPLFESADASLGLDIVMTEAEEPSLVEL